MQVAKFLMKQSSSVQRVSGFRMSFRFSSNKDLIQVELEKKLDIAYFAINDESAKHFEAHDSHFALYVVSDSFIDLPLIKR